MPKPSRGLSLAAVLCLVATSLLAVLTVAASASLNLQMGLRHENVQQASLLADSAVQRGLAHLAHSAAYQGNFRIDGPDAESRAELTFTPGGSLPHSTNNFAGTTPVAGWSGSRLLPAGRVPAHHVHLVVTARSRGVVRTREALVHVPEFPVSLASTGLVRLQNSLVGSLENPDDLAQLSSDPGLLGPGDLATNSADPQAVILENNSRVCGDVQAEGGVQVRSGSLVTGEVRQAHSANLPDFRLADYDPASDAALNYQVVPVGPQGAQSIQGLARCPGNLVISGDLVLDNSLLYVAGNLRVVGALRGVGALVVGGRTTVEGGSALSSDDRVALLSGDDVRLMGNAGQSNEFRGLIYTKGDFEASNFVVLGAFVADGRSSGKGNVTLLDSQAYQLATATHIDIFYPRQIVLQIASVNGPTRRNLSQPADGSELFYYAFPGTQEDPITGELWAQDAGGNRVTAVTPQLALATPNPHRGGDHWDWDSRVVLEIRKENDQFVYLVRYNESYPPVNHLPQPERYTDRASVINRLVDLAAQNCQGYMTGTGSADNRRNNFYPALFDQWETEGSLPNATQVNLSFDPNRFLNRDDKMRIATWQEY